MSNAGLIGSHTGVDGRGRLVGVAMAIAVAFSLVALSHAPAGAVEHEYEVASVGVDGERATYNQANDAYGNMQAFSPYSMAAGGTKVVFAKRQGYLPHHDGYVPLATDEWCGASGGCNDICIRDLVTNRTVSALSHLAVGNQHPWSYPGVGGAGQYWASSEDASTFLVSWYCYSEVLGGEVIGGTRYCTDPSAQPDDENALVLIDLDSGANEVLAVAKYAGFGPVDLSANGDRAIFAWGSYNDHATGPVKCFRPNWDCNPSSFDSVTVLWDRATGDLTAIANGTTIGKNLRRNDRGGGLHGEPGEDLRRWQQGVLLGRITGLGQTLRSG